MYTVPLATAVTRPDELTVAADGVRLTHVKLPTITLFDASRACAESCRVSPIDVSVSACSETIVWVMEPEPGVTVTVAVPEMVPLVTVTVLANVPAVVPAVKSPVVPIVPPLAATVQVGVIATTLPPASLPAAVNCCVALMAIVAGFGVIVITASAPGVTVTVAVPEMVPLVAVTVLANVPAVVPAVKTPVVPIVPPLATTAQVGVIATTLPPASVPAAVNGCVALMAIVAGFGVIVITARAPGVTLNAGVD